MKRKFKLFLIGCFLILGSSVFAQTHWTAEPANTDLDAMTITIRVSINGEVQNIVGLEVAAFCEGHIRGVETTAKVGPIYRAALTVKHDRADDMTRFKMYDPTTGIEYISTYEIPFEVGGSYGSNTNPIDVNFIQSPYDPTTINGYDEYMTVACFIAIDGTEQLRTDLQMAVYSGEQLRGFGVPVLNSQGTLALCQAAVWGNTNGEPLTYHLYDPTLGEELLFDGQIKDPSIDYQETDLLPMSFKIDGIYGNDQRIVVNFKRNIVTYIAQIGVIKYITLATAIDVVQTGQTITIIADFEQTEAVTFPAGMNLTLDLNGHDVEVTTGSITVAGNLTMVGDGTFETTTDNFIINEGAQFYHTMANINATAIRNIEQTTDGWDGIASPMKSNSNLNITTNGINELYYYDETGAEDNGLEWIAMDATANPIALKEAGRGYLYANSVDPNPNQPEVDTDVFDFEDGTFDGLRTINPDEDGCWGVEDGVAKIITVKGNYDYMVTSEQYVLNEDFILSFDIYANTTSTNNNNRETYYIMIFETEEAIINEEYVEIYSDNVTESTSGTISLTYDDFLGYNEEELLGLAEPVYIAFCHEGRKNDNYMTLDNISITSTSADDGNASSGAILNFSGVLNNADINYALSYTPSQNLKGFHLLGNPFAHNISYSNIYDPILANGYYTITGRGEWLARSADNVAEFIAPMEAFLIKAGQAGTLTIRKSTDAKRSSSNGSLMISVSNDEFRDDAYVSFNEGFGLDKISHRNANAPLIYIPQDKNYAVAVMEKDVKEIPVSFEAKQMGQYTISAEALNCEFEELYLLDKQTGTTTDLKLEDYTFIARTGDKAERFLITTSISGTNNNEDAEGFIYIVNDEIVVKNIEGEGHIRVYDLLGRPVAEYTAVGSAHISTSMFGNGIYLIQMSDENGVKVQKILID